MGDMSIAQLWWGTLAAAAVCVCALSTCVCCDSRGQLLPALLPWYFPNREGPDYWKSLWSFGKWNEWWLLANTLEMYDHKCGHASIRLSNQHIKWPNIHPHCPHSSDWKEIKDRSKCFSAKEMSFLLKLWMPDAILGIHNSNPFCKPPYGPLCPAGNTDQNRYTDGEKRKFKDWDSESNTTVSELSLPFHFNKLQLCL